MTLGAEDFRTARMDATAHVQIELSANGVTPESKRIVGTLVRIFRDSSQALVPGELIGVLRPVAGTLEDWGPLTPPDDASWARARYVEVYLRRDGDAWTIANGQLTLLRGGSTSPVNPAEAGGFGITEGPGLRPSASTARSTEDQRAAIEQANREAAAVAGARDKAPWKPQPADWGSVLAPWREASRTQRILIIVILTLAPIMLIAWLASGDDTKEQAGWQAHPDNIDARLAHGLKVTDVHSEQSNGVVPGLTTNGTAREREDWYSIKFVIETNLEGIGFNDFVGITHGAVVCDEDDAAGKTGKARMWVRIADAKASDIRDEGDHFLVAGRTFAKKLSLDLDGHIVTPTEYSIMTTTDGGTLLTGLFDPDEAFHAAFKNAQRMELASGERTLVMETSGHETQLTHVASQCTALGSPFSG